MNTPNPEPERPARFPLSEEDAALVRNWWGNERTAEAIIQHPLMGPQFADLARQSRRPSRISDLAREADREEESEAPDLTDEIRRRCHANRPRIPVRVLSAQEWELWQALRPYADRLLHLQEPRMNAWIPVTESLPPLPRRAVLFWISEGRAEEARAVLFGSYDANAGRWYCSQTRRYVDGVTHWMPLPDPPSP